MEELTSILGIVVAVGILVAKAALRKKATDAAKGSRTADPHGEARPPIPPFTTNRRPTQTNEAAPAHEASVFGTVAQKVATVREEALRAEAAERMQEVLRSFAEMQPDSAQTQVVSATQRQTAQTPRPTAAPQENRRKKPETTTANFDLRKAVIAVEILRPKFDE